jgi:hypothetical protein
MPEGGLHKQPLFLALSTNHPFAISRCREMWAGEMTQFTVIKDGVHNNGGWLVFEDIDTVLDMIDKHI